MATGIHIHTLEFWSRLLIYIVQLKGPYTVFRKYCSVTFDVYNKVLLMRMHTLRVMLSGRGTK